MIFVTKNIKDFLWVDFISFFEIGLKNAGFRFLKCKKSFHLRKYEKLINTWARKINFPKQKKLFRVSVLEFLSPETF